MIKKMYALAGMSILLLALLASPACFAQKKGKPNLKPYKAEVKKAKKGDVRSVIVVGNIYKGHTMDPGEVKDYAGAIKWYNMVANNPQDAYGEAAKGLMEIYLTGGYGAAKDINQAKKWLGVYASRTDTRLIYKDKKNLDLKNFFEVLDKANTGDKEATLLLARMYLEYNLNFNEGMAQLGKVLDLPDAAYLEEKWRESFKKFRASRTLRPDNAVLFPLMQKHALLGSNLARLELINEALNTGDPAYKLKPNEAEKILQNVTFTDPELQFKNLFLLQQAQKDVKKYATLRQMSAISHGLDSAGFAYAAPVMAEYVRFNANVQTIPGLAEAMNRNPDIRILSINADEYTQNYNGFINPLVKLYRDLQKPEVKTLVGEENFNSYLSQISSKVLAVFNRANDPRRLLEFRKAFDTEPLLRQQATLYDTLISRKFTVLGLNKVNINYYYEMALLEGMKFKTLNEARSYVGALGNRLPNAEERGKIAGIVKKKAITDVYGAEPTREQINNMKSFLMSEQWLQPEGSQQWFEYSLNSKNSFSGQITRKGIFYNYSIARVTNSDKYELTINAVIQGKSVLAYSSIIRATVAKDLITVNVYRAQPAGYRWIPSESDYLQVLYPATGNRISVVPAGGMSSVADKAHGLPNDLVMMKVTPGDFSEKTAIKTAVQYLILEYNKALQIKM